MTCTECTCKIQCLKETKAEVCLLKDSRIPCNMKDRQTLIRKQPRNWKANLFHQLRLCVIVSTCTGKDNIVFQYSEIVRSLSYKSWFNPLPTSDCTCLLSWSLIRIHNTFPPFEQFLITVGRELMKCCFNGKLTTHSTV